MQKKNQGHNRLPLISFLLHLILTVTESSNKTKKMAYDKVSLITDKNGVTKQVHDPDAAPAATTYSKTEVDERIGEVAILQIEQTERTVTIKPNALNVWTSPVISLTIGFAESVADTTRVAEYMLQFTVLGIDFALTLPNGVHWVEEPEWTNGMTYQVSIVNNLAIYAGWEALPATESETEEEEETT